MNPTSPVLLQAEGQWHKMLALVMFTKGLKEVKFSLEDVVAFNEACDRGEVNVVVDGRKSTAGDGLRVLMVGAAEAKALADMERRAREGN